MAEHPDRYEVLPSWSQRNIDGYFKRFKATLQAFESHHALFPEQDLLSALTPGDDPGSWDEFVNDPDDEQSA